MLKNKIAIWLIVLILLIGGTYKLTTTYVENKIKTYQPIQVRELNENEKNKIKLLEIVYESGLTYADFRLLKRIAIAESGFQQFNSDGSVLRGKKNKKDLGIFQINSYYHLATAERLGYNIEELEGNMRYAVWLYKNQGTKPWKWSRGMWA